MNRVGDQWYDQTPRTGHEERTEDIALFAELGIRSLRYPALWERISPHHPDEYDFDWTDQRLSEIRRLGMQPIVTLCHHGAGPAYTSLMDDSFAPGLAAHAAAVARRYPWIRDWTPVNEPLTTARFSALYGFWHPHAQDERLFWLALLNEIDATRLAMRAIRAVNPAARLIQTDDLGYCHATPPLQHEADFQNERRWIGWDLLCGMVKPGHALWERLVMHGFGERLRTIADDPCPPDVIGVNHYLSSERLLDHRVELHQGRSLADRTLSNTDGVVHVDVDAVRNWRQGVHGLPRLLEQAWERYRLPLAVTECHNGATRCDQVRWFVEVWQGVEALRRRGIDVRAVTAWSLLGSHDWNRMLTRFDGHYEAGVYDVRGGNPRPTLLADVLRDLAAGREPQAPVLHAPGKWRRDARCPNVALADPRYELTPRRRASSVPAALWIIDDGGPLARLARRACEARGLHYVRSNSDAAEAIAAVRPWGVLDARDHDRLCSGEGDASMFAHWQMEQLAETCRALDLPGALVTGRARARGVPGTSRLLIAQSSPVYVPWDGACRAAEILDALDRGETVRVDAGMPWDAVYGPDLIDGVLDLLLDGARGVASFAPTEAASEADFAAALCFVAGADAARLAIGMEARSAMDVLPSPRASYSPPTETTLERFAHERRAERSTPLADIDGRQLEAEMLIAAE
ncbi:family 1 glycosylhydrolase [Sphingomonas sp.]|uniref:family 1 glycosylhydrolase n=1 Tax=Sphingomonas sp. TaxID=28214 RepID=UPI002D7F0320|nr:family 1 glycosylhydrolase [Sphingomonas sp.]HEU0044225.1 family 1 glycosylhydrolase [Sphingomonas sp.]